MSTTLQPATKPAAAKPTWDSAGKEIVATAVDGMLAACMKQGRRWNTITASDLIVAQGLEAVDAAAVAQGIPVESVTVTSYDMVHAMHDAGREHAKKRAAGTGSTSSAALALRPATVPLPAALAKPAGQGARREA